MPKRSELTKALDYIDAEIKKLEDVRVVLLATLTAVHKLKQQPKAPKPPTRPIGVAS